MTSSRIIESPIGPIRLVASGRGLQAVELPLGRRNDQPDGGSNELVDAVAEQLEAYFAGTLTRFDIPLDLSGTPFQISVWNSLADIPFGETWTYGRQASRIGQPGASRAVGAANSKNPVPIVLPCHRVIGASGALTGYAGRSAEGLAMKRYLLEHESLVAGARLC